MVAGLDELLAAGLEVEALADGFTLGFTDGEPEVLVDDFADVFFESPPPPEEHLVARTTSTRNVTPRTMTLRRQ